MQHPFTSERAVIYFRYLMANSTKSYTDRSQFEEHETLIFSNINTDAKTTQKLQEFTKEVEEQQEILNSLPWWGFLGGDSSPPSDDNLRAKQSTLLKEKTLECLLIGEKARISNVIREHEELHPPETLDCPICLEAISLGKRLCSIS